MRSPSATEKLRASVRGRCFCPGEQGYDEARKIHNAMIDRRPAIIVQCAGVADVIAAVKFAREHDVAASITRDSWDWDPIQIALGCASRKCVDVRRRAGHCP